MKFVKLKTVDSTNNWALEHFKELDDCTVVYADSQTAARGRFERKWISGDCRNICATFILKPKNLDYLANFTQYMSLVILKVIQSYGVKGQIKWPNDVLVYGKKLSGILCEAFREKNKTLGVVLGVGVNINMPQEIIDEISQPAVSLNLVLKKNIDRDEFLYKLVDEFFKHYDDIQKYGFSFIKQDYLDNIDFLNKQIFIRQKDGVEKIQYKALTIDDNGNLVVEDKNGIVSTIYSGDLIL